MKHAWRGLFTVLLLAAICLAGAQPGRGEEDPAGAPREVPGELELSGEDMEIIANLEFFENLELYEEMELFDEFLLVLEGGEEQ